MQFSYWEQKHWLSMADFCIVGSGIVGLNCALQLREKYPDAKILILEKGMLPNGASTKNAGFACFGSLSEMLDDLEKLSPKEITDLVQKRLDGLAMLRSGLGDVGIDYQQHGGYELFFEKDEALYETCVAGMARVNELLYPVLNGKVFHLVKNQFGFEKCFDQMIYNPFEGQIDTGKMMQALLRKAQSHNIQLLNGVAVTDFEEANHYVVIETNHFQLKTKKLLIATNGFAKKLVDADLKPARAQVLITEPIENLPIKGTFHIDEGYYYFRNIDNRILLGGARNLDFSAEETTQLALNQQIQNRLTQVLEEVILPNKEVKVAHRWTGIMGVGKTKQPIVKKISDRVSIGVRLGGMGIAIGSLVGKELAEMV